MLAVKSDVMMMVSKGKKKCVGAENKIIIIFIYCSL